MEEVKIERNMDLIEFKDKPVSEEVKKFENVDGEELRLYIPPHRERRKKAIRRFVVTTAVFFLLFLCLAVFIKERQASESEVYQPVIMVPSTTPPEETLLTEIEAVYQPAVIDESRSGIEIDLSGEYSLAPLMKSSKGVKVLILHSHTSEQISESMTVTDAGRVIAQLLSSAGIEVHHSVTAHDEEGNIGSYLRMKETVDAFLEDNPSTVCVIDIHNSESGLPVTFTIGADGLGWSENLSLAEAICGKMQTVETAFRFLDGSLGQDSGVLTLNVGICGESFSDDEARAAISSFAEAFIEICSEKASAP